MAASVVHLPGATTQQRSRWITDPQPRRWLQQLACVPRLRLHARPPRLRTRTQSVSAPKRPQAPSQADRVSSGLQFEIDEAAAVLRDLQAANTWEAKVVTLLRSLQERVCCGHGSKCGSLTTIACSCCAQYEALLARHRVRGTLLTDRYHASHAMPVTVNLTHHAETCQPNAALKLCLCHL